MKKIRLNCAFVSILVSMMFVFTYLILVPSSTFSVQAESLFSSARASMSNIESPM